MTETFNTIPRVKTCTKLGEYRFLTVNPYMGQLRIDIREWIRPNKPTMKGVSLPAKRWARLRDLIKGEMDEQVDRMFAGVETDDKWHIGGNVYVTVNTEYPCVDIRHFWLPDGASDPVPSRKGIALRQPEWDRLKDAFDHLEEDVPALKGIQPCHMDEDHRDQMGMMRCPECTPNDYPSWS